MTTLEASVPIPIRTERMWRALEALVRLAVTGQRPTIRRLNREAGYRNDGSGTVQVHLWRLMALGFVRHLRSASSISGTRSLAWAPDFRRVAWQRTTEPPWRIYVTNDEEPPLRLRRVI